MFASSLKSALYLSKIIDLKHNFYIVPGPLPNIKLLTLIPTNNYDRWLHYFLKQDQAILTFSLLSKLFNKFFNR